MYATLPTPHAVNEPHEDYNPEPCHEPSSRAVIARTMHGDGLVTNTYITVTLEKQVDEDGQIKNVIQLGFEHDTVTHGFGDSPSANEPRARYNHATLTGFEGLRERRYEEAMGHLESLENELRRRRQHGEVQPYLHSILIHAAHLIASFNFGKEDALFDDITELVSLVFERRNSIAGELGFSESERQGILDSISRPGQHLAMPVPWGTDAHELFESPYRVNEPEAEYEAGGEPGHGMDRPHVSGSTLHRLLNPFPGLRYYDRHAGDL